jgi:AGZA family xanthine/uracil permease-like MFS transporter
VVTGVCFLLAMFLSPLAAVVPGQATAPALILVGWMMMTTLAEAEERADGTTRPGISLSNFEVGFPAAVTMLVMPFTYSITNGIGAGLVLYTLIQVFVGQARRVHPLLYVVALAFVVYFLQEVLARFL